MNFLNLPNWDVQALQEDEDGYVVLAQPLTTRSTCPACGSTALVKNGRDESQVYYGWVPVQAVGVGQSSKGVPIPTLESLAGEIEQATLPTTDS